MSNHAMPYTNRSSSDSKSFSHVNPYIDVEKCFPTTTTDKPSILCVHGMWHDNMCYKEKLLPYLAAAGYPAYALSLKGHGKSEGTTAWFTSLKHYDANIARVLADERYFPKGSSVVLVGHSMGGLLVQRYLKHHRVHAAVLLASTPPSGMLRTTLKFTGRHPLIATRVTFTCSSQRAVGSHKLAREYLFSPDLPDEEVDRYRSWLGHESEWARYQMCLYPLWLPKLFPKPFDTPLLVLGGANDKFVSQREVKKTARVYNADCHIFEHVAHNMMLDTRWQEVAEYMINWIGNIKR